MFAADIPPKPVSDALMAKPPEIREVLKWTDATFGINRMSSNGISVKSIRQDYNSLRFSKSCMNTPIRIGSRSFKHGLGTHANSVISVSVPTGAKSFRASVGIDNNFDTKGIHGSVQFAVKAGDRELVHTRTLTGGEEPMDIDVNIPAGVTELTLLVDTTPDGPPYDQADWADAQFIMKDGSKRWLDEGSHSSLFSKTDPPFSFTYGGRSSSDLLKSYERYYKSTDKKDRIEYKSQWFDRSTGLLITAEVKAYKEYPAVDWVLYFENQSNDVTPVIQDIKAVDLNLDTGYSNEAVVLHQLQGDSCGEKSFLPYDTVLTAGNPYTIAPTNGRPSQISAFPFWNMQFEDSGIITAVGWSGQWSASYLRDAKGPTKFNMGMENTHLVLYPGEKIRTPRILLMPWTGDRQAAHNRFRRLMLFQYVPKIDNKPLKAPVALQTFDRYIGTPDWATESGQLKAVEAAHKLGCDTYWFDAGWFVGGFPNGAGNWFVKPKEFPNGLKPVSDLCHKYGMQFILWFEPCRVAAGTQIADEHPDYVLGGSGGGLYNLGNPDALKWITDLVSQRISEFGLDAYREDYNIDPLAYWRGNDAPDRQGMSEIRFVEGHYAFWDALRERHPGLWIDNCASGGRRIDLETCMRSIPLWRSDTNCWAGHPEWNQMQSAALCQYLPLHTACGWEPTRYAFRSSATTGALCQLAYKDKDFPWEKAQSIIKEVKENQKYWYGDFYPLTTVDTSLGQFAAYQFHRPDLNEGLILAFRRPECGLKGVILDVNALDLKTEYTFEFINEAGKKIYKQMLGKQVIKDGIELKIANPGESLLIRYKAKTK